ncbi:MAG: hypothetical protein R2813_05330 [Flavobacteriales bacterium]
MSGTVAFSSKTLFILLFAAFFLDSCSGKKKKYAECDYDTVKTLAEVINMKPHPDGNGKIAVILDFKASVLALEDQELGALKGVEIDHDFLERNGIEMNNKYEVVVSELVKGDCDTKLTVAFNHGFE